MGANLDKSNLNLWQDKIHEIIFEADTPAGKLFDVILIWCIVASVVTIALDSVNSIRSSYGALLIVLEWIFTLVFTVEYILRIYCVRRHWRYIFSFYGAVDLLAIIPTYLSLLLPGSQYLMSIRVLRLLRIFRVLKLGEYLHDLTQIIDALKASSRKIGVFLFAVFTVVVIFGSIMYVVEGEANGFTDIPTSIYWAIVTVTTVGYGDISPHTPVGKIIASLAMIVGYGIIAVPTGIVTVEIGNITRKDVTCKACPDCGKEAHDAEAVYCKYCGCRL